GIVVKPVKQQKDLYRLTGEYEGWMRLKNKDAYFAVEAHPEDVKGGIAAASTTHEHLRKQGYEVAAELDNGQTTIEQRQAAFATFRDNTLAGFQRRLGETEEAFDFRKAGRRQSLEMLERLFVESSRLTVGWTTNSQSNKGMGSLRLSALPDVPLATT